MTQGLLAAPEHAALLAKALAFLPDPEEEEEEAEVVSARTPAPEP